MYSLLLCLCLSISTVFAQNITVKGTVTSAEDGLPVVGASVFVQGTTNGTVTDVSGQYTLKNVPTGSTLIFSCIGMQDLKKTADRVVDATLSADTELLEEVVVTAQGLTRKQKAIGYSAQTVSAKELTA
ncbi:MAG TPA: SusC/RagA family TonB-linked outer membrane protein, partial [Rikenellaceae bacterium]|nr:SusC/RagA family TonB-linked outer membrane protein [Rikenellaceae bacterium]